MAWSGHLAQAPVDGARRQQVLGDTHPAHTGRGRGTLLAGHALAGARARHAADGAGTAATYVTRIDSGRPDQADLVAALGYRSERYRFTMVADLPALDVPAPRHDGYDLVAFDPADAEPLRVAHERAFADYPVPSAMPPDVWSGIMITPRHARHGLSWWLRDATTGEVASYLFTREYASPLSGVREGRETNIPYLGTLPAHRGRGLAGALMSHTLLTCRGRGVDRVSLEVDAHNPTGALAFYERVGFRAVATFEDCTITEPPVA